MRFLLVLALLAACGDPPSVHDVTDCDPSWGVTGSCEVACKTMPSYQPSPGCVASYEPYEGPAASSLENCAQFADVAGEDGTLHRGCCVLEGNDIQFLECCRQEGGDGVPFTFKCP